MATKRSRYMISVDDELYNAIEDFRYEHRFPTRSEATAELIRLGIQALIEQGALSDETKKEIEKEKE